MRGAVGNKERGKVGAVRLPNILVLILTSGRAMLRLCGHALCSCDVSTRPRAALTPSRAPLFDTEARLPRTAAHVQLGNHVSVPAGRSHLSSRPNRHTFWGEGLNRVLTPRKKHELVFPSRWFTYTDTMLLLSWRIAHPFILCLRTSEIRSCGANSFAAPKC